MEADGVERRPAPAATKGQRVTAYKASLYALRGYEEPLDASIGSWVWGSGLGGV